MKTCNIVNTMGMVIAQFNIAEVQSLAIPEFIGYMGKVYMHKHKHGGGHPTFYEIVPHPIEQQDVNKK